MSASPLRGLLGFSDRFNANIDHIGDATACLGGDPIIYDRTPTINIEVISSHGNIANCLNLAPNNGASSPACLAANAA